VDISRNPKRCRIRNCVVEGEVAQLFCRYNTITAAVLSMFASLTLVPMLSGLFLNQAEAQQMLQGREQ